MEYISEDGRDIDPNRHHGIVVGQRGSLNPPLINSRQQCWCSGKQVLPASLNESGRWSAKSDD
ncbi:MAG TPA: hypothetical protein VEM96_18745 [Pyrinomonadaceae bacterium]|nr:hypothetical protein [Pyrinomonadaceae bacterium]